MSVLVSLADGPGDAPSKLSLEEIVHIANKVGLEYVDAKREAEHLSLLKASKRAQVMIRIDNGEMSEAKLLRMAEVDQEYIDFLDNLSELKRKAARLKIRYESYKNLFEARRSLLSYQKAEMGLT
tara:strand:- start:4 stop:378 length:375 start_codon:yes stop_codon:yes gene_type:complete